MQLAKNTYFAKSAPAKASRQEILPSPGTAPKWLNLKVATALLVGVGRLH
jgi:hypothetical protein